MKIKKSYLETTIKILSETKPNFTEARLRDKVIKKLTEDFIQVDKDRVEICKGLCVKEDDKPVMKKIKDKKSGQELEVFDFTDENQAKLSEELKTLFDEEINLILEGNEPQRLLKLFETTNYSPLVGEIEEIDKNLLDQLRNG